MGMTVLAGNLMRQTASKPSPYPFSIGMWLKPTGGAGTVRHLWSASDAGTNANQHVMTIGSTNLFSIGGKCVTPGNFAVTIAGTVTLNTWYFVLGQFTGAAERSLAVLSETGVFGTVTTAVSTNVVTANLVAEGLGVLTTSANLNPMIGIIAEFWRAEATVPGTPNQDYVRALAYRGPFAMGLISGRMFNYMSLRGPPLADQVGEVAYGRGGRPPWLLVGNPKAGEHPSLQTDYVRPSAVRGFALI